MSLTTDVTIIYSQQFKEIEPRDWPKVKNFLQGKYAQFIELKLGQTEIAVYPDSIDEFIKHMQIVLNTMRVQKEMLDARTIRE